MMKKIRKFAALVLTLCVLVSLAAPALAASGVQSELQGSAAYMLSAVKAPEVGSIGGEWAVIGLARSGYPVPANYFDDYYARVEKYVKDCAGVLHERKYTEYSRVILALTAIGRDPANVAGYNLLTPLGDFEKTIWQGLNGPIGALIALDSGSYDIPKNPSAKTQATRQLYVNEILNNQLADGGWNLTGTGNSDPDMTAMALQPMTVTFYEGESVFNVLQRTCKQQKIHMEFSNTPIYNSAYIEGIHNLYEFDVGNLSGWMYKVNGWFPNYGCSRYQLKDGDVIEWVYTCDLGYDVGGGYATGSE